ncbi:hypothetical protein V8E36_001751 [Tilletia maclaganii]
MSLPSVRPVDLPGARLAFLVKLRTACACSKNSVRPAHARGARRAGRRGRWTCSFCAHFATLDHHARRNSPHPRLHLRPRRHPDPGQPRPHERQSAQRRHPPPHPPTGGPTASTQSGRQVALPGRWHSWPALSARCLLEIQTAQMHPFQRGTGQRCSHRRSSPAHLVRLILRAPDCHARCHADPLYHISSDFRRAFLMIGPRFCSLAICSRFYICSCRLVSQYKRTGTSLGR